MNKSENRFLFSVIIPVYNTELYLEEAIDSIINQTVGFEDNIQIILVDDASQDDSKGICLKYKAKYPNNICFVHCETNRGPSSARNMGLQYASGKYINFMDSDDRWGLSVFESASCFLKEHEKEIDCLAYPICFFDQKSGDHSLNFRFNKDRIVDIEEDYNYLQLHAAPVFFVANAIRDMRFDEKMLHAEDTKFVNLVMLEKGKYGVCNAGQYYYRKRNDNSSLQKRNKLNPDYYTKMLEQSLGFFIQYSLHKYGKVIRYVQNMIAYAIKYRIKSPYEGRVSETLTQQSVLLMHEYLQYVSDEIIIQQKDVFKEQKAFALNLKYLPENGMEDIRSEITLHNGFFCFRGCSLFSVNNRTSLRVSDVSIFNDVLEIRGIISLPLNPEDYTVQIYTNRGSSFPVAFCDLGEDGKQYFFDICYHEIRGFQVAIPLKKINRIEAQVVYKGGTVTFALGFLPASELNIKQEYSFCVKNDHIFLYKDKKLYMGKYTLVRLAGLKMLLRAEERAKSIRKSASKQLFATKRKELL